MTLGNKYMSDFRHLALLVLVGGGILVTISCSRAADKTTNEVDVESPDSITVAPAEWEEFIFWAEKRLDRRGLAAQLPNVNLSFSPRWRLLRLDDSLVEYLDLPSTTRTGAPTVEIVPLVELGPYSTAEPSPTFIARLAPKASIEGSDSLQLQIGGFEVDREDVGSILLELSVPFGRYLSLVWSDLGCLLIPVESHETPFTVRISTDRLPDWSGRLQSIYLVTDGLGEGAIEIRKLKLLPRVSAYPLAVGQKRVRLGHEIRNALYGHCPAEIRFRGVPVPPEAKLAAGFGFISEDSGTAEPCRFQVVITGASTEKVVLDEIVTSFNAWSDFSAALAEWSGQAVSITLRAESPASNAIAFWGNPCIYEPVEDPPLLVLYLIDTVAAEHVGFQGYHRPTMPNLEELSSRGAWFARMYSNSSRTVESIPDIMLSLPVEQHGVYHNSTPVPEALVTIAECLRANGMATVSFCTNVNAGPRQGMDQGFDTFVDKISTHLDAQADRTVPLEEAAAWIKLHRDRPMFIYVHTAEPHSPYTPPEGYRNRFDPDYRGPYTGIQFHDARKPEDVAHIQALYDEELTYADARLGMFVRVVEELGFRERMDLLVTSDHGEEFMQHNNWEHGRNLHNEQTRVPLVACGPSFAQRGRIETPAQLLDLMPTILELYGIPEPYPLAGRSLWPLLRSGAGSTADLFERDIFASNHNFRIEFKLFEYSLIENGRWKLLFGAAGVPLYKDGPTSRFMLFDLVRDPRERRNLINVDQALSRRMIEKLLQWHAAQRVYEARERTATLIDAEQIKELERLGYIGDRAAPDEISDHPGDNSSRDRP